MAPAVHVPRLQSRVLVGGLLLPLEGNLLRFGEVCPRVFRIQGDISNKGTEEELLGSSSDKPSGNSCGPEFAHLVSPPPSAPIYPVAVCGHLMAQRADWSSAGGSSLPRPLLESCPSPIPIPDQALPRVSQEPEALIFSSLCCCSRIAEES